MGRNPSGKWAQRFDECAHCGRSDRPHVARGLCKVCYEKSKTKAGLNGTVSTGTVPDPDTGGDAVGPTDDGTSFLGIDEDWRPSLTTPGERTPGAVDTPSPSLGSSDFSDTGVKPPPTVETSPTAPVSGLRKLFGKKDDRGGAHTVGNAPNTSEKKPGRPPKSGVKSGKRVSTADTIADIWKGGGSILVRSGNHVPSGRWMQFQAPYAGEMIDEALAGSMVDKVALQRIAKARGRFDLLGAVIGPPLVLMAIERNPNNAGVLLPMLESAIRASLPHMVEGIKKVQAKEKVTAEAAAALFADDPTFDGQDPVAHIMQMLFADWVPKEPEATPPAASEEAVA